ncbi:hypothetical protein NDR89_20290 [Cupriavidus gilardii]|uniref:DUF2634 domain-containing protein n=1 Tax=Cupriavidus gilardii TaxID=82541 RepID=A0ABY4VPQ3_9BURK|nr:hypothetical protein [Cupriavidus gilardii]USE78978.1 hypothetical protein NDR89_20290 [Cupriavidus gilardii]
MALDLALTFGHDLDLSPAGDTSLIDGAERIAQQIKVTLLTFLGEWFLDITVGVPYLEQVLVKAPDRAALEAIFRSRIAAVPGVRLVRRIDLQIDHQGRALAVDFEVDSDEGLIARRYLL